MSIKQWKKNLHVYIFMDSDIYNLYVKFFKGLIVLSLTS